jgi:hypothetical protein
MKSILTVLGTFLFSQFFEAFARIVMVFYKQQEILLYGLDSVPGPGWVAILMLSIFAATWLAGMLTLTIVPHSPLKHLSVLFTLLFIRRISEFFQLDQGYALWYVVGILTLQILALFVVFVFKNKSDAQAS